jgi:Dipeptidyl peptidase IV (DPP IV) N-terminal region
MKSSYRYRVGPRNVLAVAAVLCAAAVLRLASQSAASPASPARSTYRGVLTFATTGNGDPFHPGVVQDFDLASGDFAVRFDGLDPARTTTGETAFIQRLGAGTYADHAVVVADARGVPGPPLHLCREFRWSDNRVCSTPKLAPGGRLVAFVTVGSGTVCKGNYDMMWGSFVIVTDRRGTEVARFEGYAAPEWLPNGRLLMMGTSCRGAGVWTADAALRSVSRIDGGQVSTPASAPAASPNGRRLAFVWNNQVWLLTLTGNPELTQLTRFGKQVTSAAWSPDGSALAALMFDVSMPVRALALFRPDDQRSLEFRQLPVYPYGPISWH